MFACRVNGKPKADVTWQFNDVGLQEASAIGLLNNSSFSILNFPNGRGVLIIGVEANRDILRGQNEIVCSAENAGGSTMGSITIEGICKFEQYCGLHILCPIQIMIAHVLEKEVVQQHVELVSEPSYWCNKQC